MKSRRTLLVRTGHGSAAASAVPGLPVPSAPPAPPLPPDLPPAAAPVARAGLPAAGPVPVAVPPAAPEAVVQAVPPPAAPPRPVPPRPVRPPAVPAPSRPDHAAPATGLAHAPLFTSAPGLNWSAPADPPVPAPEIRTAAELPPTARDIELIRSSLAVVEPVADRATAHFYALIFLGHPELRALFPAAMDVQRDRLFRALLAAARGAGDPEGLRGYLSALGRGHRRYGTLTEHYGPVGECLVAALARYAGHHWNAETELAWRRVYRLISSIMTGAAEEDARTSPPWWRGEVVAHERRTPDVAVLTVRPDQAYPYRAGQHAVLETPWWPRVWRHYSFASAPRPDGLLTFHVKAVPAGWVSNALVHRAGPGDVLRLGPPAGGMTLDPVDGADLLLVAGGTGIAPVRALVEEVAVRGGAGRSVEVFYGARRSGGLYELAALRELAERHPWLTVRPVLSGTGAGAGAAGPSAAGPPPGGLPEAVARSGPWAGRTAYLAGPPAMVRRTAGVLLRAGVPAERIRHDLADGRAAP
ncbi:globin domain-containing protein [Kitasatospora sp. NPDC056327]|uniref:globin domain-containing protein n=1 Tax=Kitasatospora sp. NPDC056327 TaxID=3345785 RepID=UPI0035D5AD38